MSISILFSLPTLLAAGACLQSVLFLTLPTRVAFLPPLVLLLARFISAALMTKGYLRNSYLPSESHSRITTAPILNDDGSVPENGADKGLVVFIVGASISHPFGVFAPGFKEIGNRFGEMWVDAEKNSEKWGFLGKTESMPHPRPGGGTAFVTVSYWKTKEHLNAFAQGPVHNDGWMWFNRIHKDHPHIGIFHETYDVPAGGWENVYHSIWPIGMGTIKYPIKGKDGEIHETGSLVDASKGKWKGMMNRLAQQDIVEK